jgi:uncharacterized protein YjbJ (UPF0337 family)
MNFENVGANRKLGKRRSVKQVRKTQTNSKEMAMNKDQVEGKLKDVAGRAERQVGEWTGDEEKQGHGSMKQAEGKVQKAWGDVKDAGKKAIDHANAEEATEHERPTTKSKEEKEERTTRRKAS